MTVQNDIDSLDLEAPPSDAVRGLADKLGERIVLDPEVRAQFVTDFGKVVHRMPGAVARCADAEQVAEVVRYCREHKIPVVGRGQGHTQTGQSTTDGGVVIDTDAMQKIHEVNTEELWADCDAGVVWRDLVSTAVPLGYVPPVLTNNLNVTIAGTTSVAGLGVASYRYGTQADSAIEIEVVTGTGEIVTCSRDENRELYDSVRCGLSQFGIITRLKTRLRPCKQKIRMYHLLYDDLGDFMADSEKVMAPDERFSSLESRCAPCPIFMKRIGDGLKLREGAQLYAYWTYPMFLTVEYGEGEEPDDEELLKDFKFHRHLRTDEYTQLEFCNRLEPVFEIWHNSGNWQMAHPWMESVLPWENAQEFIEFALDNLPPQSLGPAGHILLWPSRADTSDAPFFKYPTSSDFVMGWGILPAVPAQFLDMALEQLDMVSELSIGYGGKRYLSGYITFDTVEKWKQHFGDETWQLFCDMKKKYDPDGILNPGFISYE